MNHTYDHSSLSTFSGSISGAFLYTMGMTDSMAERAYGKIFETNTNLLKRFNGRVEQLIATDTYQFDDYSSYATSMIDLERKMLSGRSCGIIYSGLNWSVVFATGRSTHLFL